jgi:capsular exopolysaccharide synthesis family protein
MGKSFENPGSIATRPGVESSPQRSEPVMEFARRKPLPGQDASSLDNAAQCELTRLQFANCTQIELPRNADEPLVTVAGNRSTVVEAYKSLRTRLLKIQASRSIRSVVVTSVGRSEGKTLTAFNLAYCCAQVENLPVLLIDGDLRSRSLTKLLGDSSQVGLAELMSGTASYEDAIVRTDVPNLYVMGAGTNDVLSTELFSGERWNHVLGWSRDHFRLVLVDSVSMGALADFELVAAECEGILVVVRARSAAREELKTAIEQLDSDKLIGVVWNAGHSKNATPY